MAFNPLSLSPALWLSDTGSNAAQWDDLSGNGRHATQATGASQPSIVTSALNGRQVRRFDGVNDFLATANVSNFSSYTFFAVASATNWNPSAYKSLASHGYVTGLNGTSGVAFFNIAGSSLAGWSPNDGTTFGDGFSLGQNPRAAGPLSSGSDYRIVTSILSRGWINGNRFTTRFENSTGSIDAFNLPLRISGWSSTEFWGGDIAEIIILNYNATESQRKSVERYFSRKYAISIT